MSHGINEPISFITGVLFSMLVMVVFGSLVQAGNQFGLQGYSPVSYFTKNIAERGSPDFPVHHEGKTYFLTSQEQVALFKADPEQYIPALGGHCPYSLAMGRTVAIDPTRFKIVDGKLYLFHNSSEMDALKRWNSEPEPERILEKANARFILMEF